LPLNCRQERDLTERKNPAANTFHETPKGLWVFFLLYCYYENQKHSKTDQTFFTEYTEVLY